MQPFYGTSIQRQIPDVDACALPDAIALVDKKWRLAGNADPEGFLSMQSPSGCKQHGESESPFYQGATGMATG